VGPEHSLRWHKKRRQTRGTDTTASGDAGKESLRESCHKHDFRLHCRNKKGDCMKFHEFGEQGSPVIRT